MQLTMGRILTMVAVLAGVALAVWSFLPSPIPVETATATKGRFVASVDEDGKARVRERYVVAAPLAGRLSRIQFKVGDRIGANDTIAAIAPSPAPFLDPRIRRQAEEQLGTAEAARERAKAVVERSRAQAEQASTELERTRTLVQRGASTVQAQERAELAMRVADRDMRAAEFQDHAAEHDLAQAQALLARYQDSTSGAPETWNVTAPVAGLVLKVAQESETIVQPGTPLVEIGDPRDIEIVADVLSTDAVEIRPGAEVIVERWGGPGMLAARVRRIEPVAFTKISTLGVEEQRVNVLIDLTSPPEQWAGLGDGFRVEVRITVFTRDDATIIPTGALFRRGDVWHVYVIADGRARDREIQLVRRSGRFAAVGSGLSQGERVIIYPSDRIEPGVRVEAR